MASLSPGKAEQEAKILARAGDVRGYRDIGQNAVIGCTFVLLRQLSHPSSYPFPSSIKTT